MRFLLFIFCLVFLISCGGRIPSPQTAQEVTARYFKKYGKKHRETSFGQYRVTKVEIDWVREVQKDIAEIQAFVVLGEGDAVHKVNILARKKTLRWRVESWENLGGS